MRVETAVEAHDPVDAVPFNHGDMDGVAGGHGLVAKEDVLGCPRVIEVDGQDVVDHAEQHVERGLDGLAACDGRVSVADLLMEVEQDHSGAGAPADAPGRPRAAA